MKTIRNYLEGKKEEKFHLVEKENGSYIVNFRTWYIKSNSEYYISEVNLDYIVIIKIDTNVEIGSRFSKSFGQKKMIPLSKIIVEY